MKIAVNLTVEIEDAQKFKAFVEDWTNGEETPQEFVRSFFAAADSQMMSQMQEYFGESCRIDAIRKN